MKYYGQWYALWKDACKPHPWPSHIVLNRNSFGTLARIQNKLLSGGPGCLLDLDDIFVCVGTESQDCIDRLEEKKASIKAKKGEIRPFSEFL